MREDRQRREGNGLIALHAARHVQRIAVLRRSGEIGEASGNLRREAAHEADSEQRIDDLARRRRFHDILDGTIPVRAGLKAVRRPALAHRGHAHRHAQFAQPPRNHEAVAAIIARPAQHQHVPLVPRAPDQLRRALARTPHQRIGIDTAVEQRLLRRPHLRHREDRRAGHRAAALPLGQAVSRIGASAQMSAKTCVSALAPGWVTAPLTAGPTFWAKRQSAPD